MQPLQVVSQQNNNPSAALYRSLSRGCCRCDEFTVRESLDTAIGEKDLDLSAKVFGEMYYISNDTYKKGHSLLVLALKYSNLDITRLLIEQGVDMESENLYATALRGIWRSDWFAKADMLLDIAEISMEDKNHLLLDAALFFLSTDRLMPLLNYLMETNWVCFEKMMKLHFHRVRKGIEENNRSYDSDYDDDRKKLQEFMLDYAWVLEL